MPGRHGHERILGPVMLGISALEIPPHIEVSGLPKSREVTRHLNRSSGGGKQVQGERNPAPGDRRRLHQPEELLEPAPRAAAPPDRRSPPGSANRLVPRCGMEPSRRARRAGPRTTGPAGARRGRAGRAPPAADPAETRSQPALQVRGECLVRDVRPAWIEPVQEGEARSDSPADSLHGSRSTSRASAWGSRYAPSPFRSRNRPRLRDSSAPPRAPAGARRDPRPRAEPCRAAGRDGGRGRRPRGLHAGGARRAR